MSYNKILWPTDGSENALRALPIAVYLAEKFQAPIYALHVISRAPMLSKKGFTPPTPMSFDVPRYEQDVLQEMNKYLEKTLADNVPEHTVVEKAVEMGDPAEIIIDFAQRNDVELIVMSTRGRKGVSHMFLGSVAEKVIRNSSIPVMIVPAG